MRADSRLVAGNALLIVLLVIHTLDHALRQTASVSTAGQLVGLAGFVAAVVSLALARWGSASAPQATALVGIGTAVGFVAIHVLPDWGPVSQPYSSIPVDAVSWAGMIIPAFGALVVGLVGLRAAGRPVDGPVSHVA